MKELHLKFLRNLVGLDIDDHVKEQRLQLANEINDYFATTSFGVESAIIRREVDNFLREESIRETAHGDQIGSLLVCRDPKGKILLVRPRGQEMWAFPGGNVNKGNNHGDDEDLVEAAIREIREELGVDEVEVGDELSVYTKALHQDRITGLRPNLVLYHHLAILKSEIDIQKADHEIVDTLWLSPDEVIDGRVSVRENVMEIAKSLSN